jgi:dipeptidyl aminopeptidase/acylaminoacyl peptidase
VRGEGCGLRSRVRWLCFASHLSLFAACVSPLTNRIAVGEEPFVIAVGEGPDSATDLFAAPAGGGRFVRLTFNRAEERAPRLAPDGLSVAFLRRSPEDTQWSLVILDLRNSGEREVALPAEAGEPEALGWSRDGQRVIVRAQGYYEAAAPPRDAVLTHLGADLAAADSLTGQLLGEPPKGKVAQCHDGNACIVSAAGETTLLGAGASGVIRWGADSLGYFSNGAFEVRPLGGGHVRQPAWKELPARLREVTYHPGVKSPS